MGVRACSGRDAASLSVKLASKATMAMRNMCFDTAAVKHAS